MIIGAHLFLYSKDQEADRAFFRDVLGFRAVAAGEGWLIFGLPPPNWESIPGMAVSYNFTRIIPSSEPCST